MIGSIHKIINLKKIKGLPKIRLNFDKKINLKGFTLVELLVVIAIIGLLSSVAFVAINPARERARDARRAGDMRGLMTAFEMYYADNGQYPPNPGGTCSTCIEEGWNNGALLADYIAMLPNDPTHTGTSNYRYRFSNINSRQSYTMLVRLEKNNNAWCHTGVPPGYSVWTDAYSPCEFD